MSGTPEGAALERAAPLRLTEPLLIVASLGDEADAAAVSRFQRSKLEVAFPDPAYGYVLSEGLRERARVVGTGMGPERMKKAIEALAKRPPQVALVAGVSGGLVEGLKAGEAIVATECLSDSGLPAERTDEELSNRLFERLVAKGLSPRRGATVEVPTVAATLEAKRSLAARSKGALVVDMEDHAAVRALRALGARVVVARVVIDRFEDELPVLTPALDALGRPRPLAFAALLARNPFAALSLPRLAIQYARALGALGTIFEAALETLAPRD